jgi:riboflavin synthase
MFTGIIKNQGLFKGYRSGKQEMALAEPSVADRLNLGESLAINGVCLSLIKKDRDTLFFNLSEETLKRTTLGLLRPQQLLNLELPLSLTTPLSGHLVTGHIDGVGKILRIKAIGKGKRFTISFPSELHPYFVPKGSVAIDGVSLTIADLSSSTFDVQVIPITMDASNLGTLRRGNAVNIECDILGKYVYNWISKHQS